ncbi:MAG: hypothetical protein MI976_12420 [Pseudomonadales bacterium]|nr:hypothetical protein [Pseudomonadales bacterium]
MPTFNRLPITRLLLGFIAILLSVFSLCQTSLAASAQWKVSIEDGKGIAITPKHHLMLKMQRPKNGIWGQLYVNLDDEQITALKSHRLDKYFSFISVGLEIDGYTRDANAKVEEEAKFVRIDIDQRLWEGLKKGNQLKVLLPDGTTYTEKLRGSAKALRKLEQLTFRDYP